MIDPPLLTLRSLFCKRRILVMIFALFVTTHLSYSQSETLQITINANQMPLEQFIGELEQQTHLHFYYKSEWVSNKVVTYSCNRLPLNKVLEATLVPRGFEYRKVGKDLLVILPESEVKLTMMQLNANQSRDMAAGTIVVGNIREAGKKPTALLSGKVVDSNSGDGVIGATIKVEHTSYATVTDVNGKYALEMKPGKYTVTVNNLAYEPSTFTIKLLSDGTYQFELFEQTHNLNEVAIYADRNDKNVSRNQMSLIEMDAKGIKMLTAITGEKDIIKSMTRMPGVQSSGEFGSGINVRGGGDDQNLYLIDEAPLFNTAHMFGIISVLNPDAVKSATLYKGHIPAEFGERVSSVMDIKLAQNHVEKTNVIGGIGLFSSRLMVKTPIIKDKLSVQLGGRSSYSDWLLQRLPNYNLRNSSAGFYDMNATVAGDFKKNKLALTLYASNDHFNYVDDMAYRYGNKLGSLNWTHYLSTNFTGKLSLAVSNYAVEKDETSVPYEESITSSSILYTKTKIDFTYAGITRHTVRFGAMGMTYGIHPGEQKPLNDSSLIESATLEKEKGLETAFFMSDQYDITPKLSVQAGVRVSGFYNMGPKIEAIYEPNSAKSEATAIDAKTTGNNGIVSSHYAVEPRLSVKYAFTDNSSVKMSYNRNVQNLFLVAPTTIPTPDNTWKLADNHFEPIVSDQLAVGYYHNLFNNSIEISTEVYYKQLSNIQDYRNDAQVAMNPYLERDMTKTKGTNYGVELMIKKTAGKVDGAIGYTYSRSFRQTNTPFAEEKINGNAQYNSSYDKPHDLNVEAVYHANRRLRFAGNFSLSSGRPVTLPEYKYSTGRDWVVVYSDRNEYRLPTYHRLDLSVSLDESLRRKKKWKGSWTFSVMNVYARKNPYSVFYSKSDPSLTSGKSFALQQLYFIGQPLPTLTYNFIF